MRLGVALEVRAPEINDAGAIERTITPSDPPTNTSPPFDDRNTVKMVSECPETELCAMESVCCEGCVGKPGREDGI